MSGFSAKISTQISILHTGTGDLATPIATVAKNLAYAFGFGTSSGQATQEFTDTRTLAASTGEDLDLSGATLKDALGNNLAFTKVVAIVVQANAGNGGNITVGPPASNGFVGPFGAASQTVVIDAGDMFMATNINGGWTVTNSTGDLLHIANTDSVNSGMYDIYIIGHN